MLSLIVPTFQRPRELRRCLQSIQHQTLGEFELLVVDNAASSEVHQLVEEFNATARVRARYVPEPHLGLHNARHAGVRAARGELLVFTDDDATFDEEWLAAFERAFARQPTMAAAGGPVRPVWETPPPAWLLEFMGEPRMFPLLSVMEPYEEFRLSGDGLFFGVNMAIRKKIVLEVGGFHPDSFGSIWLGDGETGLNRKLWERCALVGYVPDAVVYHHVPPERMTLDYFRRREANDGAADMYARFHDRLPGRAGLALAAARITAASLRDWFAAGVLRGRTDPRALRVQLRAARSRAQVDYVLRLLLTPQLRELVAKRDWLTSEVPG